MAWHGTSRPLTDLEVNSDLGPTVDVGADVDGDHGWFMSLHALATT
jgi:hypothetical protein